MLDRIIVVVTCFALFSNAANAQRKGAGIFKFGVNASYLNPEFSSSNTARFGISIGIAPTIPLTKALYLKPEFSYSMKGGTSNYDQPAFIGSVRYKVNYFEMPIVLGVHVTKRLAIEAGPYLALRAGGNFDFNGTFFSGYGTFAPNDLTNLDYGLTGGLVFSGRFTIIGIRYYNGIQKLSNTTALDVFLGNAANHTFQIYFQRNADGERRKRRARASNNL